MVQLSQQAEDRLQQIIRQYPQKKSAVMPALYLAQEEIGWVNREAVEWVASRLELPEAHVYEVATFYTMYYKKPVGQYHFQVCRTLSCMLRGSKDVTNCLKARFRIPPNEVTRDGKWSYEEVECLGSCGSAPLAQVNDVFFENLNAEKLNGIIDRIESEQPDLRYSTVRNTLGEGLKGCEKSEVWTPSKK